MPFPLFFFLYDDQRKTMIVASKFPLPLHNGYGATD